jgi:hypothetical protein
LQITTKKLFLKWSEYYLIFYYKLVINYAVLVRYFNRLGNRISAVKISSMLIAVVETTFTGNQENCQPQAIPTITGNRDEATKAQIHTLHMAPNPLLLQKARCN